MDDVGSYLLLGSFLSWKEQNSTTNFLQTRHNYHMASFIPKSRTIWSLGFCNVITNVYVGIVGVQYITLMNTYTAINNRLMNLWQFSEEHSKLIVHTLSWFCQVYTIEKVFVVIREMKWKILRWELIILSFNCECYTWYIYLYFVQLVGFMRCDMQWSYAMITFPITWFVYIYYFSWTTCDIY